jgi:hypothetical protein
MQSSNLRGGLWVMGLLGWPATYGLLVTWKTNQGYCDSGAT